MKTLNIVESAYRATLEEQDDTIVWLTHALIGVGAEVDVLLRGNAISYAVTNQDPSGLTIGAISQKHPPRLAQDIQSLIEKGASVYVVSDDVAERGMETTDLVAGVQLVTRKRVGTLLSEYGRLWKW